MPDDQVATKRMPVWGQENGAIPRALATAVVAVPTRHDPVRLADRRRWFDYKTIKFQMDWNERDFGVLLDVTGRTTGPVGSVWCGRLFRRRSSVQGVPISASSRAR